MSTKLSVRGGQAADVFILTYLVPFLFVRSLNVMPWVQGQRQFENNVNGVIAQSLLGMAVLNGFWLLIAMPLGAGFPISPSGPVVIYLVLAVAHLVWLSGKRATNYAVALKQLPSSTRVACTVASVALFGAGVLSLFMPIPVRP